MLQYMFASYDRVPSNLFEILGALYFEFRTKCSVLVFARRADQGQLVPASLHGPSGFHVDPRGVTRSLDLPSTCSYAKMWGETCQVPQLRSRNAVETNHVRGGRHSSRPSVSPLSFPTDSAASSRGIRPLVLRGRRLALPAPPRSFFVAKSMSGTAGLRARLTGQAHFSLRRPRSAFCVRAQITLQIIEAGHFR